jgi:hypothetical protein
MARIRSLSQSPATSRVHPTEVDAEWSVVLTAAGALLQISTFGSDSRASVPKVSQTVQVDRDMAKQLKGAIEEAFPGL